MLFAIVASDKPNSGALRTQYRDAHRDYLKSFGREIVAAGPLFNEDGVTIQGSLIVIDAPSRDAAETFVRNDPYAINDIYDVVSLGGWEKIIMNEPA